MLRRVTRQTRLPKVPKYIYAFAALMEGSRVACSLAMSAFSVHAWIATRTSVGLLLLKKEVHDNFITLKQTSAISRDHFFRTTIVQVLTRRQILSCRYSRGTALPAPAALPCWTDHSPAQTATSFCLCPSALMPALPLPGGLPCHPNSMLFLYSILKHNYSKKKL